jgi:hypothetical protein
VAFLFVLKEMASSTFSLPHRPWSQWEAIQGIGSLPEHVHATRIARFFVGVGISKSFVGRAETHRLQDQGYGVFAHRNPLLWLGWCSGEV